MNVYVAGHIARTKARPLGSRQWRILAYARWCEAGGRPFPTLDQIARHLAYHGSLVDIENSLLGLAARGLVEATARRTTKRGTFPDGWRVTDAGRRA